jgi:leucyl-tRNA synthetase
LADVPGLIESFKFNVVVARTMELVNHTRKAIDQGPGGGDPAVRESAEAIALALSMFAPHTAEDMWERLGHQPSVALQRWPHADHSLLVEESVTAIVQINGKVRHRLEVSPQISASDLEALAMSSEEVQRAIGGKDVVNVVVRAPKVVSINVAD